MDGLSDFKLVALMLQRECRGDALARFARYLDFDQHVAPASPVAKALLVRRIADRLAIGGVPCDGRAHYLSEVAA